MNRARKAPVEVTWGMFVTTFGFGRTGRGNSDRLHLLTHEVYNTDALCGVGCADVGGSFATGQLCPACAKLASIASAADFLVDESEQKWSAAQRKANQQ